MSKRIAVGGIEHETNSFIAKPTLLEDFEKGTVRGAELARLGEANTIVDGFVRGVRDCGLELVPLSWAKAQPGGLPSYETFMTLQDELLSRLRKVLPVDGVLLSLHGSFAAEEIDDADGHILQSVRELVGPKCPLIAVNDLHSNISREMVQAADALIVERTYPHIDMAERAIDGAKLIARILAGEVQPTMAYRSLPLLWSAPKMITAEPPMCDAIAQLTTLDQQPGVLSASLGVGFQWVDSPIMGTSTIVVTDGDQASAQQHADELADWVWQRRDDWQRQPLSPEDALQQAESIGRYPIILADQSDNTGGGAPGDSTEILRLLIQRNLQQAAVLYMVDPEVAAIAKQAGVGATVNVELGGKSHPLLGPPVPLQAEVQALSDGRFTYDGPMWAGVKEDVGDSALLRQGGLQVIVISERQQPIDLAFSRSLGLDCRKLRYIVVKSTGHFRSGFGPIAGSIHNVDAKNLLTQDFAKLPYKRLGRTVYPLDPDASIDW
jgi:microcystin degradation protein MlrC